MKILDERSHEKQRMRFINICIRRNYHGAQEILYCCHEFQIRLHFLNAAWVFSQFILQNQQCGACDDGCEVKLSLVYSFFDKIDLDLSYKHPGHTRRSASEDLPKLLSFIHLFAFPLIINPLVLYSSFSHMGNIWFIMLSPPPPPPQPRGVAWVVREWLSHLVSFLDWERTWTCISSVLTLTV